MKELGSGKYLPTVFDFFPRLARGHSGDGLRKACHVPTCITNSKTGRGDRHIAQDQNRKDWEESVGIRRTSRSTRGATSSQTHAALARLDPKDFT